MHRLPLVVLIGLLATGIPAAEITTSFRSLTESEVQGWIHQENYGGAIRVIRKAMKESPNPDLAYAYLYCLYRDGQYNRFRRMLRRPLYQAQAERPEGAILVGLNFWRLGNTDAALQTWAGSSAFEGDPERAWHCLYAAILSADRRERTGFMTNLMRTPGISPFARSMIHGLFDIARDQLESAEKQLIAAWKLAPENTVGPRALRYVYRQTGQRKEAESVTAWLEEHLDTTHDNTYNNSVTVADRVVSPHQSLSSGSNAPLYRLPWVAGKDFFCPSHQARLVTPHQGRGKFGLDFMMPRRSLILAARGGTVVDLDDSPYSHGGREFDTFILIDHGDGTFARYWHIGGGTALVHEGDIVRRGDRLALSGRTGRSQSRHLHFEVLERAKYRWSAPRIYRRWNTVQIDFAETFGLPPDQIPGHWLTSRNALIQ